MRELQFLLMKMLLMVNLIIPIFIQLLAKLHSNDGIYNTSEPIPNRVMDREFNDNFDNPNTLSDEEIIMTVIV